MDKGVATKGNLEMLETKHYCYIVFHRVTKRQFDPDKATEFKTASGTIIEAYRINDEKNQERVRLLCHCVNREAKEVTIIDKASQKFGDKLNKINQGLRRPRTVKETEKINRRIDRLMEKYSTAGQYYDITVISSESNEKLASAVL
ncbi:MAG: hypothetical protein LBF22_02780 [Deltaproteobacteria bacterium]|nr:hypothetical protein [Deltaproteobacteria bacterium]